MKSLILLVVLFLHLLGLGSYTNFILPQKYNIAYTYYNADKKLILSELKTMQI